MQLNILISRRTKHCSKRTLVHLTYLWHLWLSVWAFRQFTEHKLIMVLPSRPALAKIRPCTLYAILLLDKTPDERFWNSSSDSSSQEWMFHVSSEALCNSTYNRIKCSSQYGFAFEVFFCCKGNKYFRVSLNAKCHALKYAVLKYGWLKYVELIRKNSLRIVLDLRIKNDLVFLNTSIINTYSPDGYLILRLICYD